MASLRKLAPQTKAEPEAVLTAVRAALMQYGQSEKLAIAFSGGLDSTVLLHAVVTCVGAARCVALHIHHGLSAHADAWLAHCATSAQALDVAFDARCVKVQRMAERGLEAAAREARYAALNELCEAHATDLLLLAHHADDQAETVLLQLLRGAGPAGLAAMPLQSHSVQCAVQRLRPLLAVPRAALEAYAAQHRLQWVEDESNQDPRYARNALRHIVLPALEQYFPAYRKTLARAARHAADTQQLLDELAALDLPSVLHPASTPTCNTLSDCGLAWPAVLELLKAHPPRVANLIRYWMRQLKVPTASSAWLDDLLRQLQQHRMGQTLRMEHAGYRLCAYRERIWWEMMTSNQVALSSTHDDQTGRVDSELNVLHWSGETAWHLPHWNGTLRFVLASAEDSASVSAALLSSAPLAARARQGGEHLRQARGGRNRTLKNLFQEAEIPVWQRNVPLIYLGQQLLFVPHLGFNKGLEHDAETEINSEQRFCLIWQEDKS